MRRPPGTRAFIRPKPTRARPAALVTLDNLEPIATPRGGDAPIRMSALSTFDGTVCAYHGDHG
uniref:Uncharacterized protein n=1 Tax=Geospiza parvula TaxID=87175 RepID=A0A8U8BSE0_GEOPR